MVRLETTRPRGLRDSPSKWAAGQVSRLTFSAESGHHTPRGYLLTINVFCQFSRMLADCQGMGLMVVALSNS
jgi:hypothetical protein